MRRICRRRRRCRSSMSASAPPTVPASSTSRVPIPACACRGRARFEYGVQALQPESRHGDRRRERRLQRLPGPRPHQPRCQDQDRLRDAARLPPPRGGEPHRHPDLPLDDADPHRQRLFGHRRRRLRPRAANTSTRTRPSCSSPASRRPCVLVLRLLRPRFRDDRCEPPARTRPPPTSRPTPATLGNGFSATLSMEDPSFRRTPIFSAQAAR